MGSPIPLWRRGGLVCFAVRLQPGAGRNEVTGVVEGALRVRVKAPPLEGRANQELTAWLAGRLGVAKSRVVLMAGRKSRLKTVGVEGISETDLLERLRRMEPGAPES